MPPVPHHLVLLALGSSLEPRQTYLQKAVDALAEIPGVEVLATSPVFDTAPVGPAQNHFLNMALALAVVNLSPHAFLDRALSIESSLGRERTIRWGDRTIDIDIILWDDLILRDETLTIPHPRMAERTFVLEPAARIVPDWRDPVSGRTVRELYQLLEKYPCNA